ncbi:MAG: hypothetical protein V1798_10795 [Pseudomonadota bacterium]
MTTRNKQLVSTLALVLMLGFAAACSSSYQLGYNSEGTGPAPDLPPGTTNPLEPPVVPTAVDHSPTATQDSFAQSAASSAVDIVWMIDNSGSMENDQDAIADNAAIFTDHLTGLDYRILIVSTDPDEPLANLPSGCTARIISSSTATQFAACAKLGDNGSGHEEGLESTHRALASSTGTDFLRTGADLQLLYVSDEEDQTNTATWASHVGGAQFPTADLNQVIAELGKPLGEVVVRTAGGTELSHLADDGHPWDSTYTYVPTVANHVAYLKSLKTHGEKVQAHAIVNTRLDGQDPNGTCHTRQITEEVGVRYQLVAQDPVIGGSVTDIVGGTTAEGACGDWTTAMDDLGTQVSGLSKCFGPLSHTPVGGLVASIDSVKVDGTSVAFTYQRYSNKVCVVGSPPAAGTTIVVAYTW